MQSHAALVSSGILHDEPAIRARGADQKTDTLLCSLHRVATSLHEDIEATRQPSPSIVDFNRFESRSRQISALRRLHSELVALTATVAQYGNAADSLHREEIATMQATLNGLAIIRESSASRIMPAVEAAEKNAAWQNSARTARILGRAPEEADRRSAPSGASATDTRLFGTGVSSTRPRSLEAPPAGKSVGGPMRAPQELAPLGGAGRFLEKTEGKVAPRKIALDDGVSLDAIIVPGHINTSREILAAVTTPDLHFIPQWDHFAVRVGGIVFHGNIGKVYPVGYRRPPERVKECRYRGRCPSLAGGPPCAYYHDPGECPGSRDVRNFLADTWVYAPTTPGTSARYGARRVGSRDMLASDLQGITASDARLFFAQTAHDIICSIVLAKYVFLTE